MRVISTIFAHAESNKKKRERSKRRQWTTMNKNIAKEKNEEKWQTDGMNERKTNLKYFPLNFCNSIAAIAVVMCMGELVGVCFFLLLGE